MSKEFSSPQHELRKTIAKEHKDKKKQPAVLEEWYEFRPMGGAKGGKIVHCKKTVNATSRTLVGFEKKIPAVYNKLKKEGKLKVI